MIWEQILQHVFPLLECTELVECMSVCKQWRDAARDDYLWKCLCSKRWPSICKRQIPTTINYYKLFQNSYKFEYKPLTPPKITFKDLEFYIDILADDKIVFSNVVPGPSFRNIPPPEICDLVDSYSVLCKLILPVEPRFTIPLCHTVRFSMFVGRKDTKKIACIIDSSSFLEVNRGTHWALQFMDEYLSFSSPVCLFITSGVRTLLALHFMKHTDEAAIDIFRIEINLSSVAVSEVEVLWLLDLLDWN